MVYSALLVNIFSSNMIWLYRILFFPILIALSPYYLKRMLRRSGYLSDWRHRLGSIPKLERLSNEKKRIWLHAVSVGELKALQPLIDQLIKKGGTEIVLTTTTSTGYALAKDIFASKVKSICLFPLDFWIFSARAWRRIQPDLAIVMESELWPEHLHQAKKRKVPILLINARLSDKSFRRYRPIKLIVKPLLKTFHHISASNQDDFERLRALGVANSNISCAGNLKFDVQLSEQELIPKEKIERDLGFTSVNEKPFVLLGSSTWPGEEALLLRVQDRLLKSGIHCRLLLVPRHTERKKEIIELITPRKLSWSLRSEKSLQNKPENKNCFICIGDTTGELTYLTQAADVAFIGKSLPPNIGGQTPIDAAAFGIPIVYGPHMNNFRNICKSLEAVNAAIKCQNESEVEDVICQLAMNETYRKQLGQAARQWHLSNQGATEKTLTKIYEVLDKQ